MGQVTILTSSPLQGDGLDSSFGVLLGKNLLKRGWHSKNLGLGSMSRNFLGQTLMADQKRIHLPESHTGRLGLGPQRQPDLEEQNELYR